MWRFIACGAGSYGASVAIVGASIAGDKSRKKFRCFIAGGITTGTIHRLPISASNQHTATIRASKLSISGRTICA
jgi:hypothetical protein